MNTRREAKAGGKIVVKQNGTTFFAPNNESLGALKSFLIRRLLKGRHDPLLEPDLHAEITIIVNDG